VCPQAASGCAVPMNNALELKSRRFRQHIAFYSNPRKGTHGGRLARASRSLVADEAAYPAYPYRKLETARELRKARRQRPDIAQKQRDYGAQRGNP